MRTRAAWLPSALVSALGAVVSALVCATAASASGSLGFPTDQKLVPLAVGAAFALPACAALTVAMLLRFWQRTGLIGSAAAAFVGVIALIGYLKPGMLRFAGL